MRKSGRPPPAFVSFGFRFISKALRPKGTTGTPTRVQTPLPPNPTSRRRAAQKKAKGEEELFTTMSSRAKVPAALWSRVDAAPKVRTTMCSFWMGSTSSPPAIWDGGHLLFLSLSLSRRKRTNGRRDAPSPLTHVCCHRRRTNRCCVFLLSSFREKQKQHRTQS